MNSASQRHGYSSSYFLCVDDMIEQSRARSGGSLGNKGEEAAVAAIQIAHL